MPLQRWSAWSKPGADPFDWLDDWLQENPGVGASLLAVGSESALHGRLLYLREPEAPAKVRLTAPDQSQHAAIIADALYRRLSAVNQHHWQDPLPMPRSLYWLPANAKQIHALPLVQEGRIAYWLCLSDYLLPLTLAHLAELNLRAALGLGTSRLFEAERQQQLRSAAVSDLAEVQRLLQPKQPQIDGLDYALHWQPAETAAGDYYDVMPLSHAFAHVYDRSQGDVWGAMIGDVSGHGAAAAMEAAQFDAILRTYKPTSDLGPAGALSYANRYFFSRQSRQRLMTVLAARYRPDTQELVYANAGHLPLLIRRGDEIEVHSEGDIPIGVLREQEYRNASLTLRRGDLVLMYTDGVVEARSADGKEFGLGRLQSLFAQGPPRPQAMLQAILEALFRHQGGPVGSDDQTVVVLRVTEHGTVSAATQAP